MKMLIEQKWLDKKVKAEPSLDFSVGIYDQAEEAVSFDEGGVEKSDEGVSVKHTFGQVIQQLRLRDKLTVGELADEAKVSLNELQSIESDPEFSARPRTVVQLSTVFNIDKNQMMKLSGLAKIDGELNDAALKFAANSNGISTMSKENQEMINDFVKLLNQDL